jgi:hypothetical protein
MSNQNQEVAMIRLLKGTLVMLALTVVFSVADSARAETPADALACGALAEIVVVGARYAPQIAEATASQPAAVEAEIASWLGISAGQLEGAMLWISSIGIAAGWNAPPVNPGAWMEKAGTLAAQHTLVPMWGSCLKVWGAYRTLPADLATIGESLIDNGADGAALRGPLSPALQNGKACLEQSAGRWRTLLGSLGISYRAWRDCRGCCDGGTHDPRFDSADAQAADYFRNAPEWTGCMAVCNGLAHGKGDDRFLE